jgi:hypothetical protein
VEIFTALLYFIADGPFSVVDKTDAGFNGSSRTLCFSVKKIFRDEKQTTGN